MRTIKDEVASDPARLYARRQKSYLRLIRSVGYPQGIRAFFLSSPLLRSHLRVLDAGCGTGIVTLALREALHRRGLISGTTHAFDLTPAMLESFKDTIRERSLEDIELAQADVLALKSLPLSWNNYDLIVSAAMLEYVPRGELPTALGELRELLVQGGSLLVFISRRNWLTRPLIARWWRANVYSASEIRLALQDAGFSSITFCQFPARFRYLALWGYIVEARRET